MRQSSVFILLLISLLTACTAPKTVPLPTTAPSATPLPNPTATLAPTATITPEPTATPGFRVENGTLVDEQGQPVELAVPLLEGIQLDEVRNLGDGVFEVYAKGRLMQVNDGTGWVLAPMGMRLQEGIWSLWDTDSQTWTAEWNVADFNERIAELGLLVDETLVHPENFKTGEMQCIAPELCFHMQVKPEKAQAAYFSLLEALTHSSWNTAKRFWQDLGLGNASGEQAYTWLKSSPSPDGQPSWLPAESPNMTSFNYVQNNGSTGNGRYRLNELISESTGCFFDGMYTAMYSTIEWANNPWVRSWFSWLRISNGKDALIHNTMGVGGDEFSVWGLLIHPIMKRPVFVVGSTTKPIKDLVKYSDNQQLGGQLGVFRINEDTELMDKYFASYVMNYSDDRVNSGQSGATSLYCVSPFHWISCDGVVGAFDRIFEPQPRELWY